jgi:Zn-dependent M28 family amino/carboxypeptidase
MKPPRAQRRTKKNLAQRLREPSCPWWLELSLDILFMLALASTVACSKGPSADAATANAAPTESAAAAPAATTAAQTASAPPDSAPLPHIDAKRAFEYTREVTAFGTRYMGNENHKKLEGYITDHLKEDHLTPDEIEDDVFVADTVEGKFPVRNIIAKFPGTKDGIIVILGHYDTVYPLRNSGFVGANDGGSSTAILLEFANQLRGAPGKKRDGNSVWLVWSDGEEAVRSWTPTDSLYGTRHLAEQWEKDGTLKQIKALMVMDMIGDADLNIDRDRNSTPWLLDLIYAAAEREGYQSHFYAREAALEDDHLPFVKRGVPSADVIDLDYGYNNVFHHTAQDTMDKLSPKSLQIVGDTIMETIHMLDQR